MVHAGPWLGRSTFCIPWTVDAFSAFISQIYRYPGLDVDRYIKRFVVYITEARYFSAKQVESKDLWMMSCKRITCQPGQIFRHARPGRSKPETKLGFGRIAGFVTIHRNRLTVLNIRLARIYQRKERRRKDPKNAIKIDVLTDDQEPPSSQHKKPFSSFPPIHPSTHSFDNHSNSHRYPSPSIDPVAFS